jgi:UDP-3-O-[3-hydroxymyristoyl] glucosamine N-acyltransferase
VSPINKRLSELARDIGGRVIGDGQVLIRNVASIEEAGPGEITFLANPRYQSHLRRCRASAVIVGPGIIKDELVPETGKGYLEVSDPYLAFAQVLQIFAPPVHYDKKVSSRAFVDPTASLGADVTLFPGVFVAASVRVGKQTVLYPGVFLGEGAQVGDDCVLHPNVVVGEGCSIGNRVILHAGVVVGSDGFGYAGHGDGRIKIPQVGIVEIQDDVEIGANTTVDRATFGKTVISRRAKIDNLVQIAHNVIVGENSIIAAQVGIAGSTRIGKDVTLLGQAGVLNHLRIGDGATIGPQSGIPRSVPPGVVLSGGIAAAPHQEWLKVMALLPHLPKLWNLVRALEKKMSDLVKGGDHNRANHVRR